MNSIETSNRKAAIQWWNQLSQEQRMFLARQFQIKTKQIVTWQMMTGRQIENVWKLFS
jgi:uncharacterized protein with gpF-like domain